MSRLLEQKGKRQHIVGIPLYKSSLSKNWLVPYRDTKMKISNIFKNTRKYTGRLNKLPK